MTGPRRFDPAELAGPDSDATGGEIAEATLAARALEASLGNAAPRPSADLADRVMAAVRLEPAARRPGILATLRRRPTPRGLVESLGVAWRRALAGGPLGIRATALAYVAAVVILVSSITGAAAYGAAGALGFLATPSHGPDASEPIGTPAPLVSPEATTPESPEPSESIEPAESEDAGGDATPRPGQTEASDDGSGGGSDGGATASPTHEDGGGDGQTASPTSTRTPEPAQTPTTEGPSSSGSGSGSGSGG